MKKILLAFLLLISLIAPLTAWANTPDVVVSHVSGEAEVIRGSKTIPVTEGMKIKKKDLIKTGPQGHVDVSFYGQAGLRLLTSTEVKIAKTKEDASRVNIEEGNVLVRFIPTDGKKKKKDRFQVETPVVIAGVRGTQFWGRVEKGDVEQSTFAVREGIVRVKDKSTGKNFTLKQKDAIEVGAKIAEPRIRPALDAELDAIKSAEDIKILSVN